MNDQQSVIANIACLADYESKAQDCLTNASFDYIAGGSADEITLKRNRTAFDNIRLKQKVLTPKEEYSTKIKLLGQTHEFPFLVAPVAYQALAHDSAETGTIMAAMAQHIAMVLSTLSSTSMEEIAGHKTHAPIWFQLYCQSEWQVTADLIRRAECAGYDALVVTVDAPINGLRNREQRNQFTLPTDIQAVNLQGYPHYVGNEHGLAGLMASAPNWQLLERIIAVTSLPVVVKGIMTTEDAVHAKNVGAQAVIVSNHGGRVLDGVPASIEVLADVRAAVGENYTLLLDSGIRRGSDIFKALALGANSVMIGRPILYALAVAGPLGVAQVLKILKDELLANMILCGCGDVNEIGTHNLILD